MRIAALLAGVLALVPATAMAEEPRFIPAHEGAPFSAAVAVGDMLYLSGQIGTGPDGKLVEGWEAQSRQTMDNIAGVLKREGLSMDDVVKCTVMLGDMSRWPEFNRIYLTYFKPGRLPARSAFGANGLAMGAVVEVECLAKRR